MPVPAITVLHIEDNVGDARLLWEALSGTTEPSFALIQRTTLRAAVEFLHRSSPDIVLLDLGLPDAHGMEALTSVRSAAPTVPVVVLTVMNDDAFAVQALKAGAQDYLVKGQIDRDLLRRALRYSMERQRVQLEAVNFSHTDELTGLCNRRGFLALAEHQARVALRDGKSFLVIFVQIEGMQQIQQAYGRQEGNRAIVDAAGLLMDCFRRSDIVGRIGENGFGVLATDSDKGSIETIVQRVQRKLGLCNAAGSRRYDLSLAIGTVLSDAKNPTDVERLLIRAEAMRVQLKVGEPPCADSRTVSGSGARLTKGLSLTAPDRGAAEPKPR